MPFGAPPQIARETAMLGIEDSDRFGVELRQAADLDPLDLLRGVRVCRIGAGSEAGRRLAVLRQQRGRRRQLDRFAQGRGLHQILHRRCLLGLLRLDRGDRSSRAGRKGQTGQKARNGSERAVASEESSHPEGFSLPEWSAAGFPK